MQKHLRRVHPLARRHVVWVTGASRGIGREIALQFASVGCSVALSARSQKELNTLEREIVSLGGHAESFPCDIAKRESVFRVAKHITKSLGDIDVLINNAGITAFKPFHRTSVAELENIVSVNLTGALYATKAVYPSMVRRRSGWIINIISTAAVKTFAESSAYSVTKSGLQALGRVLREEARAHNVRVTNVYPGSTATRMWSSFDLRKYSKRMMSPASVAEVILSLYRMPSDVVVEEIVLRPIRGDID